MPQMSNDRINSVPALAAVQAAYAAVTAVQHLTAEEQVAGIALLFFEMVRGTGISPMGNLMSASLRRSSDADSYYTTEIRALRAYIKDELA